ncbi:MAG: HAMP domain-containing histidine kinase, partial [Burkholderiales bacterium]|nr:HAMP domain-containing histidine kinase [Burkholderiales bacterium]
QRMLGELEHGVRRASHLVEQLLTLARQDAHGQPPEKRPTRFDDLARTVVTNLSRIAEQRQLDLGVERAEPVTATVDPDAVETLLSNLVQNALRYTPPGGQVDVDAFLDADGAPVLRVTDTGPGIPVAERERVFDRFYRRENDGEGSGIGLAIVRRIADAHGAHVELSDRPTGNGLRVTVRFGKETAA